MTLDCHAATDGLHPDDGGHRPVAALPHALRQPSSDMARVLRVAAVFGPSFSADDVAELLGDPIGGVLLAVQEAVDAGFVVVADDALAFSDDALRRAVYLEIAEPLRNALHHQIGELLLRRGGASVAAAGHLAGIAHPGDRLALACLDRATGEVMAHAPESAADFALRALALTDATDEQRFNRTVTAVDALVRARRLGEATGLARYVLAHPALPAPLAATLRVTLSSILFMHGRPDEAVTEAELVLAGRSLPEELYTGAELMRLTALLAEDDLGAARARAEAILAGLDRSGADSALAGALVALSFISWRKGQVEDALGLVRAAVQRSDRGAGEGRRIYPRLFLANRLTALGQFDEADRAIRAGAYEIELVGDAVWAPAPAIFRSQVHAAAGRLPEAEADARAGLATADDLGTPFFVPIALTVLATVALHRGHLHEAAGQIERYRAEPPSTRVVFGPATYIWNEARLADAQDGPARAVEVLEPVYDELVAHKDLLVDNPAAAGWLVRAALAVGDGARAAGVVACAERLVADNPGYQSVAAAARHARGLLDRDAAALEAAASLQCRPWARASAFEDAAAVLAEAGDERATGLLQTALEIYVQVGASRDEARVLSRLRDAGVLRRHWHREDRPVSGWQSLTDSERRVSELVAEGLTNAQVAGRLYLSRHTVDFHLRRVFCKLDICSRVQLTRSVLEHSDR